MIVPSSNMNQSLILFSGENYNNSFMIGSTLRKLYWKEPNVFGNFYRYDLSEIKSRLKEINEEDYHDTKQENFISFKAQLEQSVTSAIEYITSYILQE